VKSSADSPLPKVARKRGKKTPGLHCGGYTHKVFIKSGEKRRGRERNWGEATKVVLTRRLKKKGIEGEQAENRRIEDTMIVLGEGRARVNRN